jgi:ankyrin repeat protein
MLQPLLCAAPITMTHKNFYDLILAIKHGDAEDVGKLLRRGANPNILGRALRQGEGRVSALAIAMERADTAMVEHLLRHGANPHDIDHVYSAPTPIGATTSALHFLCGVQMHASNWCAIAERLLDYGVRIEARNRAGLTALQLCTESGQDACRSFLVSTGADVLATNSAAAGPGPTMPATPLHGLAQSGQWKNGLLALVKRGADINAFDPDLNSPLDLAVARAVRAVESGSQAAANARVAICAWIAAGAHPSAVLIASYPENTWIGDALRMYRIDAAVACGDQRIVWHVLETAHDKQDANCQAAGARLDMRADDPDMAEALDLWLASGYGDDTPAPIPPDGS